jgi:DNA-directed RNA polymerase subunit K/omega
MSDIKSKVQSLDPNVTARDVVGLVEDTKNIYETLCVVTKRAKQLSVDLKHELNQKLQEFSSTTDAIEEIQENKEQIEISKFYERLPNPAVIALDEFQKNEIHFRYPAEEKKKK